MLVGSEATGGDWAEEELGAVALGDGRLTSRLVAQDVALVQHLNRLHWDPYQRDVHLTQTVLTRRRHKRRPI